MKLSIVIIDERFDPVFSYTKEYTKGPISMEGLLGFIRPFIERAFSVDGEKLEITIKAT